MPLNMGRVIEDEVRAFQVASNYQVREDTIRTALSRVASVMNGHLVKVEQTARYRLSLVGCQTCDGLFPIELVEARNGTMICNRCRSNRSTMQDLEMGRQRAERIALRLALLLVCVGLYLVWRGLSS